MSDRKRNFVRPSVGSVRTYFLLIMHNQLGEHERDLSNNQVQALDLEPEQKHLHWELRFPGLLLMWCVLAADKIGGILRTPAQMWGGELCLHQKEQAETKAFAQLLQVIF